MESVRVCKLEKYMEITVSDDVVEDKLNFSDIPNLYNVGLDLSLDANIFYGSRVDDKKYKQIILQDFDNYDIVLRLLHWSRQYQREDYGFRVLKSNKNEKVDFYKEIEMLNSRF